MSGDPSRSGPAAPGAAPAPDIVDAHVHIFPPEVIRDRESYAERDLWFRTLYSDPRARMATAEEVLAEMDRTRVATSVVFGFAFADQGLCRLVNDYVIETMRTYPGRLAGLACVAPDSPGVVAEVERCLDAGLVGCGELVPRGDSLGEGWHELAAFLEERGMPMLLHANEPVGHEYAGKGAFPLAMFAEYAAAHRELDLVLGHMGGGLFFYELMPELRRSLARVYYDTAAVPYLYEPGVYSLAVSVVGQEKIIFGSDYPLLSPGRYFDSIEQVGSVVRSALLSGNARRVFGL